MSERTFQLKRLDVRPISAAGGQIRGFACFRNELVRLPYFLKYHRELGVDEFFFIVNLSTDGTVEYLLAQEDCHCFRAEGNFFAENVHPPLWTNGLLNVFGEGTWCLTLDADEMFVYPHCEDVKLRKFCRYLEVSQVEALSAAVIDMYSDGPVIRSDYRKGEPFLKSCPYFDPAPGWTIPVEGRYPAAQMFGGVRERVFWQGRYKKMFPPCISTVPLVKWRKGQGYLAAQHFIGEARFSELRAIVLHFKFLTGFYESIVASIEQNAGVAEKGLQERSSYVDTLARNLELSLRNEESVVYRDSQQLVELGWARTSDAFESYATANPPAKRRASGKRG